MSMTHPHYLSNKLLLWLELVWASILHNQMLPDEDTLVKAGSSPESGFPEADIFLKWSLFLKKKNGLYSHNAFSTEFPWHLSPQILVNDWGFYPSHCAVTFVRVGAIYFSSSSSEWTLSVCHKGSLCRNVRWDQAHRIEKHSVNYSQSTPPRERNGMGPWTMMPAKLTFLSCCQLKKLTHYTFQEGCRTMKTPLQNCPGIQVNRKKKPLVTAYISTS